MYRLVKFDPKVGCRKTTKIENLVILDIILVALILLPYHNICAISSHAFFFIGKGKIT